MNNKTAILLFEGKELERAVQLLDKNNTKITAILSKVNQEWKPGQSIKPNDIYSIIFDPTTGDKTLTFDCEKGLLYTREEYSKKCLYNQIEERKTYVKNCSMRRNIMVFDHKTSKKYSYLGVAESIDDNSLSTPRVILENNNELFHIPLQEFAGSTLDGFVFRYNIGYNKPFNTKNNIVII